MTTAISNSTREGVLVKLTDTSTGFLDALAAFSVSDFNKVPFAGSWTPTQVAEHVYKSISGIPTVMRGNVSDTSRDPGEMIPQLEGIFLDFTTKLKSPDFILPSDKKHDQQEMISSLSTSFKEILETAATEDLSKTCLDFKFPGSGYLTRLELINFAHVHTRRHTHQLQKIKGSI